MIQHEQLHKNKHQEILDVGRAAEAILSNSTRKVLWFEITEMLIAV